MSIVDFLLIHLIPRDPAAIFLGSMATEDMIADVQRELGLDKPLVVKFLTGFLSMQVAEPL